MNRVVRFFCSIVLFAGLAGGIVLAQDVELRQIVLSPKSVENFLTSFADISQAADELDMSFEALDLEGRFVEFDRLPDTEEARELVDAMARLFRLRRDPVEEQALGAAALREVYFRVLRSKHGQALQQLIHLDSKATQIARAIAHIRKEYRSTIKAADLASIAGMSASIFYENFKQITANSPLQYQKDLRLHEAQQMLQQAQAPVSQIALAVGYESPAQFSREFSRKFGAAPKTFVGAQAS